MKTKIQNKIYSIFAQYPDTLELFPKGLTNQNWIFTINSETYIFRIPTLAVNDYDQERNVIQLLQKENLDVETVYFEPKSGIKITKFIPDLIEFKECKKETKIVETALLMKKLHSLQIKSNVSFNPIQKLELYQSKVKVCPYPFDINQLLINISQIKQEQFLCHNDWVSGNILFGENKNYLIDYEYAADNDPLFDVMSFLTENNIDDEQQRKQFYLAYFDQLPDSETQRKLDIWEQFHNCLWCFWALMMFEEKKEQVYKEIADMKYSAWKRIYEKARI